MNTTGLPGERPVQDGRSPLHMRKKIGDAGFAPGQDPAFRLPCGLWFKMTIRTRLGTTVGRTLVRS